MKSDAITIVTLNAKNELSQLNRNFYFIPTPVSIIRSYQLMNILHFNPL